MACLKKKFPQVKYHKVFWACEFDAMLKSAQATCFVENIQPNLRPFSRLKPRETVFGGIRQTFCRKWIQSENTETTLHFLDLNSAYSYVCSNENFPYGKCHILIDDQLKDVTFQNNRLILKSSGKKLCGLVKAIIITNEEIEPYLPTREKETSEVYYAHCSKCLKKKSQTACHHKDLDRELEVTITIDSLNYAIGNGYCTLIKLLEIWVMLYCHVMSLLG